MSKGKRVTISLNSDDFKQIESTRSMTGLSRSAFIHGLIRQDMARRMEQEAVERYLEGYRDEPESTEEIEQAMATGLAILARESWEI